MKQMIKMCSQITVAGGVILTVGSLVAAESPSVEERLNQLEKTVQALQKENTDLKTQLGADGKSPLVVVKPAGKEAKINIGGYLQGQAEFGDEPDTRYTGIEDRVLVRRARLNVTGSFAENFDFKLEGDFGANAVGEQTGYRAQLSDVFINWNRYSFANVKLGQFKTPFGYEQLVADTKLLTVERSLPNDRLTDSRQIGLGVAGDFFKKRLSYSVGVFNGTGVNNSFNDNDNFLFAGRISGVAYEGTVADQETKVAFGINGLTTKDNGLSKPGFNLDSTPATVAVDNLFVGKRNAVGVDGQFKWGRFGIEAEYLRARFEPTGSNLGGFESEGYYALGTFFIIPKKLQAVVKYEVFDPNLHVSGDTSDSYTFGLNYFLKGDDLKLTVNYVLGDPAGPLKDQGRLFTRVQLVF